MDFCVVIPSEEHSRQLQIAAEKHGYRWGGNIKVPYIINATCLVFRNGNQIYWTSKNSLLITTIPTQEKSWQEIEQYFNFTFQENPKINESNIEERECKCDGKTLLWQGCQCGSTRT